MGITEVNELILTDIKVQGISQTLYVTNNKKLGEGEMIVQCAEIPDYILCE